MRQKNYHKMWQVLQTEAEFIAKCDKKLLQSVTGTTKCDSDNKVRRIKN